MKRNRVLFLNPLLRAIHIMGSRNQLIRALGISAQRLNSWLSGEVAMSYEYALALEYLTFGEVTAVELSPGKSEILKKLKINVSHHMDWMKRRQTHVSNITVCKEYLFCEEEYRTSEVLESFVKDIKKQGLLHPIVIDTNSNLILGKKRLYAYKALKKSRIPSFVISAKDLIKDKTAFIELKKHFTLSECIKIGIFLENNLKHQGQRNDLELHQNFDETQKRTDEWVSQLLKIGCKDIYRQAKKVIQHGIPPLIAFLDEEKVSIYKASLIADLPKEKQHLELITIKQNQPKE